MVRRDLREILDYYDSRSDTAGDRFFAAFGEASERIKMNPTRFHRLDQSRRRCDLIKFPYHLVFEIEDEVVFVTVFRHHRRHQDFGMRRTRS